MDCLHARHDLAPGLLGALDEAAHSALEKHLKRCDGCRREYEELDELLPLLDLVRSFGLNEAPVPAPPVPDPQRAVDAVRAEVARRSDPQR